MTAAVAPRCSVRTSKVGTGSLIATSIRARLAGTDLAVLAGPSVAGLVQAVGLSDEVRYFSEPDAARSWIAGDGTGPSGGPAAC